MKKAYSLSDASRTSLRAKSKPSSVMQSQHYDDFPEEITKKYKVKEVLGEGLQGVVFRAKRRATNEAVVIKQLKTVEGEHDKGIEFLRAKQTLREVSILRHLNKQPLGSQFVPGLLEVIRGGTDDSSDAQSTKSLECSELENTYLIMELVDGVSLQQLFSDVEAGESELSIEGARRLVFNLLRAVQFIHKAGVLHRDIKPEHIIVAKDEQIKIIDFGLARTVPESSEQLSQKVPRKKEEKKKLAERLMNGRDDRRLQTRCLSPHVFPRPYRPPEVCLLENSYSFSADIWSIGCIIAEIYSLLEAGTPKPLFQASSCFPLSPLPAESSSSSSESSSEDKDLLKVMLGVLGDQKKRDVSFVTSERLLGYVRSLYQGQSKIRFDLEFPSIPKEMTDLLFAALEYNPHFRHQASSLLAMPAFETLRQNTQASDKRKSEFLTLEYSSKSASLRQVQKVEPLMLSVDRLEAFDYKAGRSRIYSITDLYKMLQEELEDNEEGQPLT